MNPAFSVILFTTLSGAGYGLLAWLGVLFATSSLRGAALNNADVLACHSLIALLATGMGLAVLGLISSTFHLGKPMRSWRAFSQWRTSWLSREGVLAMLTLVPATMLAACLWTVVQGDPTSAVFSIRIAPWLGGALALLSLLTVGCTGMIYASLQPIPAWRHPLVVPVYLVFSASTGCLLLGALSRLAFGAPRSFSDEHFVGTAPLLALIPIVLAGALAVLKHAYWKAIDRIDMPSREAATALEGYGTVATFERPHTEANYLTREMGFVLARKHSRKLRAIALLLFAGIPPLALLVGALLPVLATLGWWCAALCALAGACVERWLFFAEAKHMVMLYY